MTFKIVVETPHDPVASTFKMKFKGTLNLESFKKAVSQEIRKLPNIDEEAIGRRNLWLYGYNRRHCGYLEDVFSELVDESNKFDLQGRLLSRFYSLLIELTVVVMKEPKFHSIEKKENQDQSDG
jgi:hypothetical protein